MLYIKETEKSVDEVCQALCEAAPTVKFGVLGEHNLKEKMAAKGVEFERECRVLEVCNPHQAKKVLESDMAISNALPCRISVYEEQGKVKVSTIKPSVMLGMFDSPELQPVAAEVEEAMIRMIDQACE